MNVDLLFKIVQLIQAAGMTFIAKLSGLSIALIDTPIFSVYSWVLVKGQQKRWLTTMFDFMRLQLQRLFCIVGNVTCVLGAIKHHFFDKGDEVKKHAW